MATSSPFTQASNFLSAVQGSVDPRTGMFSFNFQLAHLRANNTLGPQLPMCLNYSPMNAGNVFGLGNGVSLGLTSFDDRNGKALLQLSTGEQYKTFYTDSGDLRLRQHKLDTIRLDVVDKEKGETEKKIHITHKAGGREILAMVGGQGVFYPVRLETPLGHAMKLNWDKAFRLSSVIDEWGGKAICTLEYPVTGIVIVHLWPGTAEATDIRLLLQNDYLSSITHRCPDGDLIWQLGWDEDASHLFNGWRPLAQINSPAGLTERVMYESGKMRFRTLAGEGSLPAVVRHTLIPGVGQAQQEVTYEYSSNNYMGYGAVIQSPDPDSDNLYNVLSFYDYWSRETLRGSVADSIPDRITERHYNNYHLLVSEKRIVTGTMKSTLRETTYNAVVGKQFIDQPTIFQMPAKQTVTWSDGDNSRKEITTYTYDSVGNLIKTTAPDGTVTTCEYYPAEGAGKDCPPEPNGFTRFVKSKTVTPPAGVYKDVPVHRDIWRYEAFPVCKGSSLAGAVIQTEAIHQADGKTLYTDTYEYVNNPADCEHGRIKTKTVIVQGDGSAQYTTTQSFSFDSSKTGQLNQTVQTVVDEHPGQSSTKKLTLAHSRSQSSLTGRLLNETDVAGNSISYKYDIVGRLRIKTNHSDKKPYTSTEQYVYTLPDSTHSLPAQTTYTDIRGNKTRTSHDGLGRVVMTEVLDTDGTLGWKTVGENTFDMQGLKSRTMSKDYLRNTGENASVLTQTLSSVCDNWGMVTTVTGKEDGVDVHRVIDPVGKIWPDKKALGQLTTEERWHSAQSDGKVTPKKRTYYDRAHSPVISELYAVAKDGKTWESVPFAMTRQIWDTGHRLRVSTDASGYSTAFQYDAVGRTVATSYADGSVVKKRYAEFSLETLTTHISLIDPKGKEIALGEQIFDGLARLTSTSSGGRTTTMTYDAAWQQHPSSVNGPDGAIKRIKTDAVLGEAPRDIQASGNAADVHQSFVYDLPTAVLKEATEANNTLTLTPWPSGRLKAEMTTLEGDNGKTSQWQYSLGGRPQIYSDVGGMKEFRVWKPTGQLASIIDETVTVNLNYDSLNRLTSWVATEKTGGKMSTTLTFDSAGREKSRTLIYEDKQKKTLSTQSFTQSWTVSGQLSQRTLTIDGQLTTDEMFTYDSRNRLKTYSCGGSKLPEDPYGNTFTRQQFTFDALGNITTCVTTLAAGVTDTALYHFENKADPCQLTGVSHSLTDKKYHYPAKIVLEYDKAGRMTKDEAGRTLKYDALGRLHSITGGSYGYDAHNRMVYQKVDKTGQAHRLYYRANRLIGEWLTKGDGKKPKPDDRQVRLVYAAGNCVAQEDKVSTQTAITLIGTDGKQSVVATAQDDTVKTNNYTPYGYLSADKNFTLTDDPDAVAGSTEFTLEFPDHTAIRTATIYSNGMNQVPVIIKTVLTDSNGHVVRLSAEQLWAHLTLKTTTGYEIKPKAPDRGYAHLSVWNVAGDFTYPVPAPGQTATSPESRNEDQSQVIVYLSTAEPGGNYEIYAELNFKNFAETTKGGSGEGHYKSVLNINTITPVDLNDINKWTIKKQPASDKRYFDSPPEFAKSWFFSQEYRLYYQDDTLTFFSLKETGSTLSPWYVPGDGAYFQTSRPLSALMSWSRDESFTINAWTVISRPYDTYGPNIGFNGPCWWKVKISDEGWKAKIEMPAEQDFDSSSAPYNYVSVYRSTIQTPMREYHADGWDDANNHSEIEVIDIYGNRGVLSIEYKWDSWDPELRSYRGNKLRILSNTERDKLNANLTNLSDSEREAALQNAGAFHLTTGLSDARPADSEPARALRQKFGSKAIPSDSDFVELIDLCTSAVDVLSQENASAGGLKWAKQKSFVRVEAGPGFSISGGKLTFDVTAYMKDRK